MQQMRTGPVRGKAPGVAAIDVDGSRYCIDCAKSALDGRTVSVQYDDGEWETIEDADGELIVEQLIRGEIYTLGAGGVCLRNSGEGVDAEHCAAHSGCVHALEADEHTYDHDERVGVRLDL